MKNLKILSIVLIAISFMISCEKETMDMEQPDPMELTKGAKISITEKIPSTPISENGVEPFIIPGKNKGGNRTCEEVEIAFAEYGAFFDLCGDRVDYGDDGFASGFPDGLTVKVDGVFVSFEMDGCIQIDGINYKVGAVIVKGSNNANVYYYENGTLSDGGLTAPERMMAKFGKYGKNGKHGKKGKKGKKGKHGNYNKPQLNCSKGAPMVSNLTFCFVECEKVEDIVVAVKALYWAGSTYVREEGYQSAASSSGDIVFTECPKVGANTYPAVTSFSILDIYHGEDIGTATVEETNSSFLISVDLKDDGILNKTWIYAGSLEGLLSTEGADGCPEYSSSPLWSYSNEDANVVTFTIPKYQ